MSFMKAEEISIQGTQIYLPILEIESEHKVTISNLA